MPLYALLSFWPAEIGAIYTTDPVQIGVYGLPFGIGTEVGSVVAGFLLKAIGHTNWFLTGCCFFYTVFMGLYAILTPETIKPGLAFGAIAGTAIAAAQLISIVMIQFSTSDEHIGKATGLSATFRNVGGALASKLATTSLTTPCVWLI
jgi:predicted MFS family arabinose efflux permease